MIRVCLFIGLLFLLSCSQEEQNIVQNSCSNSAMDEQVKLPAGVFRQGDNQFYIEESPISQVSVESFWIDKTEVTNDQFKKFVNSTGYITRAERGFDRKNFPNIGEEFLVPGSMVFIAPEIESRQLGVWWKFEQGANWRKPYGGDSSIEGKGNFPVVQVTIEDARAYAKWAGRRLPTEQEWEYAALAGNTNTAGSPKPKVSEANYWQGAFPFVNTAKDGYKGMSPVGCFDSNDYGLYDMVGNVWELTESVFYPQHNAHEYQEQYPNGFDYHQRDIPVQVIKGGSYLCAQNYCKRYRPAARQAQDAFLATSHIGFRTVRSAGK